MRISTLAICASLALTSVAFGGTITYTAALNGGNESPPNASPGTGFATVIVDNVALTMEVMVNFTGLTTPNSAAHIHCCTALPLTGTAGVATITPTFTGFPSGTTSGTYDHVYDLTSSATYNPAFITAQGSLANAEASLLAGLNSGTTYLNIHTTQNPGGEIRGFLVATPEPSTFALGGLLAAGLLAARRRLRS